ncbi:hypothetical protein ACFPAF_12385 [Hymenobacter endophyticus]|uniref:Type II toxin-antitoxin system prevent-host-death family antitoxin n=1 Tax=Hymenobacter endophyticus TaxID=3076335 RepID=A0ABU3TIL1_9BACT|nr:hypothetical protein [Hymenobacter endophyticus]MDU0371197.1 hypothetical protein [Hymenobacter endophyticus]
MKITFEVPESRAGFLLELLRSLPYVTLHGKARQAAPVDETAHLMASPTNAARLQAAIARDKNNQREVHELPASI